MLLLDFASDIFIGLSKFTWRKGQLSLKESEEFNIHF